jgi:hypothetical protein
VYEVDDATDYWPGDGTGRKGGAGSGKRLLLPRDFLPQGDRKSYDYMLKLQAQAERVLDTPRAPYLPEAWRALPLEERARILDGMKVGRSLWRRPGAAGSVATAKPVVKSVGKPAGTRSGQPAQESQDEEWRRIRAAMSQPGYAHPRGDIPLGKWVGLSREQQLAMNRQWDAELHRKLRSDFLNAKPMSHHKPAGWRPAPVVEGPGMPAGDWGDAAIGAIDSLGVSRPVRELIYDLGGFRTPAQDPPMSEVRARRRYQSALLDALNRGDVGEPGGLSSKADRQFKRDLDAAAYAKKEAGEQLDDVVHTNSVKYNLGMLGGTAAQLLLGKAAYATPRIPPPTAGLLARGKVATDMARVYKAQSAVRVYVDARAVEGMARSTYGLATGNFSWMDLLSFAPIAGKLINKATVRILDVPAGRKATNLDCVARIDRADIADHGKHVTIPGFDASVAESYKKMPDGTYDFIFVNNPLGIEFKQEALAEWRRIVKPGGMVIIQGSPNSREFRRFMPGEKEFIGVPRGFEAKPMIDRSRVDSAGQPIMRNGQMVPPNPVIGSGFHATRLKEDGGLREIFPSRIVIWEKPTRK